MMSSAAWTIFRALCFFPPILPAFFEYFFPKCMMWFARRSTMFTSSLPNFLCSWRPIVVPAIDGFSEIVFWRPWSTILIPSRSHFSNKSSFGDSGMFFLPSRFFLPPVDEFVQRNVVHFVNLKTHSWNVAHGAPHRASDSLNANFVVFVDEIESS